MYYGCFLSYMFRLWIQHKCALLEMINLLNCLKQISHLEYAQLQICSHAVWYMALPWCANNPPPQTLILQRVVL